MLSLKSIGKSPFELDNRDVFEEAANENFFNSCLGNHVNPHLLSPPEVTGGNMAVTSPMPLTPPDPTGGNLNARDAHDLASALAQHAEALASNNQATQELMQSVGHLTAAIKGMNNKTKYRNTSANIKTHNKKMKRYKDYITKFLKLTKNNKATRGTLRRNLGKLESTFLSHVLKDLIENKHLVKSGTTYALVQNND